MRTIIVALAFALTAGAAAAQSPYAGMQMRAIKALSDQQIDDLKAGRGMGYAMAAELNGYPGPAHVLELADKLDLSAEQRSRVQQLFDSMKAEAMPLGTQLIEQETALNEMFSTRKATSDRLKSATASIATIQGNLREAHLKYHLLTVAVLRPEQIERYNSLRGYGEAPSPHQGRRHHFN